MITILQRLSVLGLIIFLSFGCGQVPQTEVLQIWSHQGQEAENRAMREIVAAFNETHAKLGIRATIEFFPDYQYTERLSIAAAAGDMPDVFGVDGPTVAQFVESGLLHPLSDYFSDAELDDFLDTIINQGTIGGVLYTLGAFDSALVLYYDRVLFDEVGIESPPFGEAWDWQTFLAACQQLKEHGISPVSLHMNVTADEWFTYAFSPLIWSGGGHLIDTDANQIEGVLNSAANIATLTKWQALFTEGFAARNPMNPNPFGAGETAMDWNGHWMARSHFEAKGHRLGVMPLPKIGDQPAAASGSWSWAIASTTDKTDAAVRWIRWITDPETGIMPIVNAGGAVPSRQSAFEFFPEYEKDPFRLFRFLLESYGRSRPQTPLYPNLTQQFAAAVRDIAQGADVEERLNQAASAVQRLADR